MGALDQSALSGWLALFGQNIAIGFVAVACIWFFISLLDKRHRVVREAVIGAAFGCAGLISMLSPVHISGGIILDMRNVFVLGGGMFGGPAGALVSTAFVTALRAYLGGGGVISGVGGIVSAGLIGGIVGLRFRDNVLQLGVARCAAIGLFTAIVTVALSRIVFAMRGMPPLPYAAEGALVAIYPIATATFGLLLSMVHYRTYSRTQERLADVLETASDLIWETDEERRITFASGRYQTLLGYAPEELLGNTTIALGGRWIDAATERNFLSALEVRRSFEGLLFVPPARDGGRRVLSVTGRPYFDEHHRFRGYRGTAADVTERVRQEEELRRSYERLTAAQRIGKIGTKETDLQTGTSFWSEETYRILGLEPGAIEPTAESFKSFVHPEDIALYDALSSDMRSRSDEYRIVRPDGEVRWVHRQADVIRDEEGQPLRLLATMQDITERRRLEDELRNGRGHLEMAQRVGRIGSIEADLVSNQSIWSEEMHRILGVGLGTVRPSFATFLDFVHPDDRDLLRRLRARTAAGEENQPAEFRILRPDGEVRWLHREAQLLRNAQGNAVKLIATMEDVTERMQMEEALRESRDSLVVAQRVGRIGSAVIDLVSDTAVWSEEQFRIYGLDPAQGPPSLEDFFAMVHPDDRRSVQAIRTLNDVGLATAPAEFRIIRPDGVVRWIHREVEVLRDDAGAPVKLITTQQDVTERQNIEERLRRSNDLLARAQRIGRIGSSEVDLAENRILWSDEFYRILGLDPAKGGGGYELFLSMVHPDDRQLFSEARERNKRGEMTPPIEFRCIRPDGEVRWMHREVEIERDASGKALRLFAIQQDITERRRLEDELRRNHERLVRAQRTGHLGSVEIDIATREEFWSEEFFDLCGLDQRTIKPSLGLFLALVHPDDRDILETVIRSNNQGEANEPFDFRILHSDGTWRWLHRGAEILRHPNGSVATVIVTFQDVTERERWRRLVETLNANVGNLIGHDFLRSLTLNLAQTLDAEAAYIGRFEQDGTIRTQYLCIDGEFAENRVIPTIGGPGGEVAIGKTLIVASGLASRFPGPVRLIEGVEAYAGTPLFTAKGDPLGLMVVISTRPWEAPDYVEAVLGLYARRAAAEIERLQIESDIELSRARMAEVITALDAAEEAVILGDDQARILYANDAAFHLLGLPRPPEEFGGKRLRDFQMTEEFSRRIDEALAETRTSGQWNGSLPWMRPDSGQWVTMDAHFHRLPTGGYVAIASDASPRLKAEEERRQQQMREAQASKLEALGNLAGGIAHDFNNLLQAILGFGQFLASDLSPDSDQYRYVERILSASRRGKSLVQQILAFSRRSDIAPSPIVISDSIVEAGELLKATLPPTTEIEMHDRAAGATVLSDKGQMMQILVNLCVNASDAMGGEQGRIVLSIDRLDRARPDLARLPRAKDGPSLGGVVTTTDANGIGHIVAGGLPDGECVSITVRDRGSGIPEDIRANIFDPFFTTKIKGRGTGIGLAVVHRIATEHGGAILVTTGKDIGTTFEIILPVFRWAETMERQAASSTQDSAEAEHHASVLIVDDDEALSAMVETALARRGHKVQSTTDPRVALMLASNGSTHWDVLVTDQSMPHMRGQDLIHAVKEHAPTMRCIICTGFSSGLDERKARKLGAEGFLTKPFNVEELVTLVERLTADRAGPRSSRRSKRDDSPIASRRARTN